MVDFGTDYWNATDRQPMKTLRVSTKDLGVSSKMGDVLQNFKADLTAGANHVELGFTGKGKGSLGQGNTTPEMFGKEKRKEIRRMSKLNEVSVSTHASLGIGSLSGLDMQNKRFSDTAARETLSELKRTVDFAGEACGGGAVVVHTGEFPREVSMHPEFADESVKKEEMVILVDNRTGQFRGAVNKGEIVYVPKFEKTKDGKQYVDYMGNPTDSMAKAMPIVDEKDGRIQFDEKHWDDFVKDAKKEREQDPKKWKDFSDEEVAAKLMHLASQKSELERAEPFAYHYYTNYQRSKKQYDYLQGMQKDYERAEKGGDIDSLKMQFAMKMEGYNPSTDGKPSEYLATKAHEAKLSSLRELEGFEGYAKQIHQIEDFNKRVEPISKEGKCRSAKHIAQAAMYAIQKEESLKRQGREVDKPIFIAPENLFPESGYGSHPRELRDIIQSSRKELINELRKKGKNAAEAKKMAEDHIKATFDIGHAYTWKKFFKPSKKDMPLEDVDKEFNKWMLKEIDKLNEEKIIGHVHISDNFGYYDEHLTPEEGTAPITEFVNRMKKAGFKDPMIVEWGAQSTEHEPYGAMLGSWAKLASSPLYRIDGLQQSWTDIEQVGYFGRASSPNFIIGNYGPSKDWNAWGWSEASIE